MAGVRDPAFWRRFSRAIHQDEETGEKATPSLSSTTSRPSTRAQQSELKHAESWLERQQQKKSRRVWICWLFWVCMAGLVTGVVIVVLWLETNGVLDSKSGSAKVAESTASTVPGVGQGNGMGGAG